jgi:hypothetical protein
MTNTHRNETMFGLTGSTRVVVLDLESIVVAEFDLKLRGKVKGMFGMALELSSRGRRQNLAKHLNFGAANSVEFF